MARRKILVDLLSVLIQEWGKEEVLNAVRMVEEAESSKSIVDRADSHRRSSQKLSAISQVDRLGSEGAQHEYLSDLAAKYDQKEFLPSVPDVKQFLQMHGERPGILKDRTEAFRIMLKYLKRLPLEQLRNIAASSQFSGPARLGPISDAISATGERFSRWQSESFSEKIEHAEGVARRVTQKRDN